MGGLVIAILLATILLYKAKWWRGRAVSERLQRDIYVLGMKTRFAVLLNVIGRDALAVEPLFYHYKKRWSLHFLVFYGFLGLMLTTTLDAILNRSATPLPLDSPIKIIGNVSGLLLLLGATPMLFRRNGSQDLHPLSFSDRVFLPVLYLATMTGFVTEGFDYGGIVVAASAFYLAHIAIVTALLVSAPWSRFVHSLQSPYLALHERLRQNLVAKRADIDYKRLDLARYAKENFFSEYLPNDREETEKSKRDV